MMRTLPGSQRGLMKMRLSSLCFEKTCLNSQLSSLPRGIVDARDI